MSGEELVRKANALDPGLPVLLVSGNAEAEGVAPDVACLTKPFKNAEWAERWESLISQRTEKA